MLKTWDILNWEKIQLIIKRHNISYTILWIIVCFALIVSIFTAYIYKNELVYLWIVIFLQFILSIIYFLFINNELNLIIITSKKIIIINKKNLFEKNYNKFELKDIEEIKATSKWLFQNIFNYWELVISIKNNSLKYKLKFIPDTINTAKTIINLSK